MDQGSEEKGLATSVAAITTALFLSLFAPRIAKIVTPSIKTGNN